MRQKLVIFFTVLLDLIGFGIVIPLLPFYALEFSASPLEIGLLFACYSMAQFLFAPVWGALSDRHGRRPILLMSIGLGSLMLAGFAASTTLWMLFLFRSLHGIFAANISTAQAYIADITAPEDRAKGMGMLGAAFGLGFTIGPWIGGELSVYGHAAPIWLACGLSALNFVLAYFMLPESRDLTTASERRPRPIKPTAFLQVFKHPAVGTCILLTFVMTFAFSMMEASFALFGEAQHNLEAKDIGRLMGVMGVVMILVQGGLIGRLSKRFGEATLVRVGLPCLGLSIAALGLASPAENGALVFSEIGAVCAIIAFFHGITQPSLFSIISRRTSADDQGLVMGTNQSLSALARATAPAIGLFAFGSVSIFSPFFGAAAMLILATALAGVATREPKAQPSASRDPSVA
jgi:DHA1 family tetracycline resistance protein-like MFS transporter